MKSLGNPSPVTQPYLISIREFLTLYLYTHPGVDITLLTSRLNAACKEWEHGLTCDCCGKPMWIIGSALCGWRGCHTCMEGRTVVTFPEINAHPEKMKTTSSKTGMPQDLRQLIALLPLPNKK